MPPKLHKPKTQEAKINSTLMKDINRIRKTAEAQTKMNILRKYQIKLFDKFLKKLLAEKRITKEEIKQCTPKKKDIEKILFKQKS